VARLVVGDDGRVVSAKGGEGELLVAFFVDGYAVNAFFGSRVGQAPGLGEADDQAIELIAPLLGGGEFAVDHDVLRQGQVAWKIGIPTAFRVRDRRHRCRAERKAHVAGHAGTKA